MGPRLGQHFLRDESLADRIVSYAQLSGSETVLEVGPGRGVLTGRLAQAAGDVVAVEADEALARDLAGLHPDVRVVAGDVLEVDWPPFDVAVANLPYGISSPFTFRLLDADFDRAVLMYQRAFAERLAAEAGTDAYGRLSVAVQVRAEVELLERVPPGAFDPPPDVESGLVEVTPRAAWSVDVDDAGRYDALLRAVFQHRRKQLANGLAAGHRLFSAAEAELKDLKGDLPHGRARPGALSPADLAEVERFLAGRGIDPAEG